MSRIRFDISHDLKIEGKKNLPNFFFTSGLPTKFWCSLERAGPKTPVNNLHRKSIIQYFCCSALTTAKRRKIGRNRGRVRFRPRTKIFALSENHCKWVSIQCASLVYDQEWNRYCFQSFSERAKILVPGRNRTCPRFRPILRLFAVFRALQQKYCIIDFRCKLLTGVFGPALSN